MDRKRGQRALDVPAAGGLRRRLSGPPGGRRGRDPGGHGNGAAVGTGHAEGGQETLSLTIRPQQLLSCLRALRSQDQAELWGLPDVHLRLYDPGLCGQSCRFELATLQEDPETPMDLDDVAHTHVVQVDFMSFQRAARQAKEQKATRLLMRLMRYENSDRWVLVPARQVGVLVPVHEIAGDVHGGRCVCLRAEAKEALALDAGLTQVTGGYFMLEYMSMITKSVLVTCPLRLFMGEGLPLMVQIGGALSTQFVRYLLAPCLVD